MERLGYSAGTTDSGEWLTILGSHHAAPTLYATEAEARDAIPADLGPWLADRMVVKLVREVYHPGVTGSGRAYRIVKP